MISASNPIHRMNDIVREQKRLAIQLAPFYAAFDLIASDNDNSGVERLESIPAFRKPWEAMRTLQEEFDRLAINLALSWERTPVNLPTR